VAPDNQYAEPLLGLGARHIRIPLSRKSMNPIRDAHSLLQFVRAYRRERPQVILHSTIKPAIYGSIAARVTRVPSIVNVIPGLGFVFTGATTAQRGLRHIVEAMYRLALANTRVVFLNADDREYFVSRRIVRAESAVILPGLGVDTDRFSPIAETHPGPGNRFLMISRVLADKGVREYAGAARMLRMTHPGIQCRLLGPVDTGNPTAIPGAELQRWTAEGAIEYIPEVKDVRPYLAAADVVVLPSYREGMPGALLEAMAMGKPVVATDVPGCRDAVIHRRTGLLVPPRDIAALAAAMGTLMRDPELRTAMGLSARARAVEVFDSRRVTAFLASLVSGEGLVPSATLPCHPPEG
jgi:glycosyltransferase involved in cell wall biosynthesis